MIATTNGKIWHPAPQPTEPCQTGDVLGVNLSLDEEVEWVYEGVENRVTGYIIKERVIDGNNTR